MLTRRHIRVKVMQCIYALTQARDESLEKQVKFLRGSIDNMYTLYLLMMSLLKEVHNLAKKQAELSNKKYLEKPTENYPDENRFLNNRLLNQISGNTLLKDELGKRKLKNWYLDEEYVKLVYKATVESEAFIAYMKSSHDSFEADRGFVLTLYRNVIAPNEKLYDYFEDSKLTWVDDIPIVNTFIVKLLKKAGPNKPQSFFLPKLIKDKGDIDFAEKLLTKTLLNDAKWEKEIEGKTPNWDNDRIAEIDSILLKMAICELLNFPSIPEKVTINEFLEIAKEYSTPKSSIFINGILDKLTKEYKAEGKLKKMGRGLL